MGAGTSINFQPIGNGQAAIAGDLALTGEEVEAAVQALRVNGIETTALHSHMLDVCISGPPPMHSSWPRVCAMHWTKPIQSNRS